MSKPKTLDEAVAWLDSRLNAADKEYLDKGQYDAVIELHHSLGRYIRNELGLWQESEMAQHLRTVHNVNHPDDMSSFIVMAFLRRNYPTVWQLITEDDEGIPAT